MLSRPLQDSRFRTFPVRYRHTDAVLGCSGLRLDDEHLRSRLLSALDGAYRDLDQEIAADPVFATTLRPRNAAAQTQLGREINPKVMTPAEWATKRAEGHPFVQELLAKPRILLIGTLDA